MVPLQVILLSLVILFYTGFVRDSAKASAVPLSMPVVLLTVLGSHLLLVWVVAARTRRATRLLHQPTIDAHAVATSVDRLIGAARWTTVLLAGLQLWGAGWGPLVLSERGWNLGRFPLAAEAVFFLPALLSWLCFWSSHYQLDSAMRERALAYRLAMGLPAHPMPPLGHYLSMQMRHNFFLLVPMAIGALVDRAFQHSDSWWGKATSPATMGLLFLVVPWLVTRIWITTPMVGDLRERLIGVARRYKVRFRNILIWRTHNHVSNAAILGYLPFARYFLMTDALLESLTDRQIEAVFAHEVGHGYHRHVWWYMAAFAGASCLSGLGGEGFVWLLTHAAHWKPTLENADLMGAAVQAILMGGFVAIGFSRISKRFEYQADWFAAQHMAHSLTREPERLSTITLEQYATVPAGAQLVPALVGGGAGVAVATVAPTVALRKLDREEELERGAEMFSSALRTVLQLAHKSMDRGGWLHPSARQREEFLVRMAESEEAVKAFNRSIFYTRLLIVGLLAVGVVVIMPEVVELVRSMHA